jgi:hypothetical protein
MLDQLIEIVAKGNSFIDVGPLWGAQKLSVAHKAGATKLAAIDVMPKDDEQWVQLALEINDLRDNTDFICGDFCNLNINYDVVYCSGVLYHQPNPILLIKKLYEVCNKYTILSTTYTESVVENTQGTVSIAPGGALFLPAVPELQMNVLREDWKVFLDGRPGDALSFPQENWDFYNLHHWWWLFTEEYVRSLCLLVGFQIRACSTYGKILSLLLKKA